MTVPLDTPEARKHQEEESQRRPLPREPEAHSLTAQWTGLLLAPAVFFLHLQGNYLLVLWACENQGIAWVHAASAAAIAVAALGAFVAWRLWGATGRSAPGESPGTEARARFLAVCGLAVSSVIVLILVAQLVTGFFVSPCH